MKNIKTRLLMYFTGLFIMTAGISLSVKSDLGVSPVSSVPYMLTCIKGTELGKATILFHILLVVIQIIILRKRFKARNLLQIAVGIVFGYFTTFSNYCIEFLPDTENIILRMIMMIISCILVAFGIFLYIPADIMPLAGEGTIAAISDVTGIEFSKAKIAFDVTLVIFSLICCLLILHNTGSVGIGTAVSAVLVGTFLGGITKILGSYRDRLLKSE